MHPIASTAGLLILSNIFMTFAWYAHLRDLGHRPWVIAALISWGIAFFEYMIRVPANRIGYTAMNLGQLKILQEAITLTVFVPFAAIYMKEPLRWDYLWAALCILGAVFFIFRPSLMEL
ncbi:MAG: DMT family protein, partial [Alphaproteobacteria bacterium]